MFHILSTESEFFLVFAIFVVVYVSCGKGGIYNTVSISCVFQEVDTAIKSFGLRSEVMWKARFKGLS